MKIFLALGLLLLTQCTPADASYCERFGVTAGSAEFPKCIQYFHTQEQAFMTDYSACAMEADATYPPTLYDTWHTTHVHRFDPYLGYPRLETVSIPPDANHNAQVDALRLRIIGPCMHAAGWNSPETWQAGRHPVTAKKRPTPPPSAPPTTTLPWLKR